MFSSGKTAKKRKMTDSKIKEISLPQEDEFRSFINSNITENINHARHVETEIHTFTGIYMAVVAGVLAFDFTGKMGMSFGLIVHSVILLGGLLAMLLLTRWYLAFDTFMASAECLSYLEESMLLGKMTVTQALDKWHSFTKAFKEAAEAGESKPKNAAFSKILDTEEEQNNYSSGDRLFAFSIPKRSQNAPRTRDFIFGFHVVIMISVGIILVKDLYSVISRQKPLPGLVSLNTDMIKLIATDLDHTLLNKEGLVPEETKQLIRKAVERGTIFSISTGRSIKSARGVAESIGAAYMAICYNGALVIDPVNGVTIYENYLDEDIVKGIVQYAHEHDLYIQMYDEGTIVVEKLRLERHPDPDLRYADYREVGDFLEYPFFNTPKILLACEPERVPAEQAALEELYGERVYMAQSDAHLIEVVSEGVDKGVALENLAGYLGCSKDEVIAFGDNTNDLPLLMAAGTSVAVANAVPSVKEWADYVAEKERSEGFAEGLLKYMPELEE